MPPTAVTPRVHDKTVTELDRLGFRWELVPQFDLDRLSHDRRVQVREGKNYAPREMVERYAVQMEKNEFPPIVVTSDDYIVDGNTRIGASLRRKQTHFPAYVLTVKYETEHGATEKQRAELRALAATLNQQNGLALTPKEAREIIKELLALEWLPAQIGRAVGVTLQTITAVKKEIAATERLNALGLRNGAIAGASLRALGSEPVLVLNDEPYKQLTQLAVAAGLNTGEIIAAAKEIKETGSDTAGLTKVQTMRAEMADRIRQKELTGVGKPPAARMLRARLGYITKFADDPRAFVETNEAAAAQHIAALQQTISILEAVLREQKGAAAGVAA